MSTEGGEETHPVTDRLGFMMHFIQRLRSDIMHSSNSSQFDDDVGFVFYVWTRIVKRIKSKELSTCGP